MGLEVSPSSLPPPSPIWEAGQLGSRTSPSCPASPAEAKSGTFSPTNYLPAGVVGGWGGEGMGRLSGLPIGLWAPHLPSWLPRDRLLESPLVPEPLLSVPGAFCCVAVGGDLMFGSWECLGHTVERDTAEGKTAMLPQLPSLQNGFSSPSPAVLSQASSLCGVKVLGCVPDGLQASC